VRRRGRAVARDRSVRLSVGSANPPRVDHDVTGIPWFPRKTGAKAAATNGFATVDSTETRRRLTRRMTEVKTREKPRLCVRRRFREDPPRDLVKKTRPSNSSSQSTPRLTSRRRRQLIREFLWRHSDESCVLHFCKRKHRTTFAEFRKRKKIATPSISPILALEIYTSPAISHSPLNRDAVAFINLSPSPPFPPRDSRTIKHED